MYSERRLGKTSLVRTVLESLAPKKYVGVSVDLWPRGCGARMMAFFPFKAAIELPRGVTVGFVQGCTAPTTPTGFAISVIPVASSRLMIPMDFLSRSDHQKMRDLPWIFFTLDS